MSSELDPRGIETKALFDSTIFVNSRVLEIGSGDGRLTFRYGEKSRFVIGIDTKVEDVNSAVTACPSRLRKHLQFLQANAIKLPFRAKTFDIVLFAWSL